MDLMQAANGLLDQARQFVRRGARSIAKFLNWVSGGKLSPNAITYISLLGHVPIAWLIATQHFVWGALLLVIFGLMDTLDGELARLQQRASPAGMLLDASTDRMKESLLYIGSAYALAQQGHTFGAVWAVAACAGALLVSYVKAKGETAVAGLGHDHHQVNHLFEDGLARYEIRMFLLILGLLSGWLLPAIIVLALLAWYTAVSRLITINRYLKTHVPR